MIDIEDDLYITFWKIVSPYRKRMYSSHFYVDRAIHLEDDLWDILSETLDGDFDEQK